LEKYKIPATIFITTGKLGKEFWWDELERIVFESENLSETLYLLINSNEFNLRTGNSIRQDGFDSKYRLLRSLHQWMQSLSNPDRDHMLCQLRGWSGVKMSSPTLKRALTSDELVSLSQHDLIEVGSHSITHVSLPLLPEEMQKAEVLNSKLMLEKLLGQRVNAFSYPSGLHSGALKTVVSSAGFDCACSSANDVVWYGSDPFALPRFWLQHYNHDQFERWLRIWLVRT
jgi:peptidoglycan/xylan/chitin deacetylase (PgdA/CDA1 family)